MKTVENKEQTPEMTTEEWLAIRKEAGLTIDPDTAEVCCWYAQMVDPYGVFPELAKEYDCIGREYFARSRESHVWVCFSDLPEATRNALWQNREQKGETIDEDIPF
ncbi:hypothetical protein [Bradyrhizobium sp. URHD0069]|uniref:hypothetical protein n=1 Tax=Bradyrhizobium sp. URHD0069 TaxID=1380355 RepID=UPI0004954A19|nr:hypothetical protein [Bradyrhizobium sp. URHD0069]